MIRRDSSVLRRILTSSLACGATVVGMGLLGGCLDRPVAPAEPHTSNTFSDQVTSQSVNKIDLLFMIDNSASMADKQNILAAAVPQLVGRLVTPSCIAADGTRAGTSDAMGACPDGSSIEFQPIKDIHIGVVTSSLGTNGADECSEGGPKYNATQNDSGHLISRVLGGSSQVDTYGPGLGFLAWDPSTPPLDDPPGESDSTVLNTNFTSIVTGAGQDGCGYEAQLEGWYRFLIEPNPPSSVTAPTGGQLGPAPNVATDLDTALLEQRAEFLRPDSLVAIVMLTDENDCSIAAVPLAGSGQTVGGSGTATFDQIDAQLPSTDLPWRMDRNVSPALGGFPPNYITAQIYQGSSSQQFHMPSGTSACSDPESPDCQSCLIPNYASDAGCKTLDAGRAASDNTSPDDDNDNMRCWNQKARFGVDTLYPLRRYVEGLTQTSVYDFFSAYLNNTAAPLAPNPLFQDLPFLQAQQLAMAGGTAGTPFANVTRTSALPARDKNLVFLAGIVGVPWQDIFAIDPTTKQPSIDLGYRSTSADETDPNKQINWDLIIGQVYAKPQQPGTPAAVLPTDPFMVESITARTGTHPITGDDVAMNNKINGHEWSPVPQGSDLEYACIFDLPGQTMGDCDASSTTTKSPLCEGGTIGAGNGVFGSTQTRAKAFPCLRELAVLRAVNEEGGNSIPGSICAPNTMGDPTADTYGYNPAVAAIIDRLKSQLTGRCLPRKLATNPDGTTPCIIIDAQFQKGTGSEPDPNDLSTCEACTDSTYGGLEQLPAAVKGALYGAVANYECLCELKQLTGTDPGTDGYRCRTAADPSTVDDLQGWCYIDPGAAQANGASQDEIDGETAAVSKCGPSSPRTIRILRKSTSSTQFITCLGASLNDTATSSDEGSAGAPAATGDDSSAAGAPATGDDSSAAGATQLRVATEVTRGAFARGAPRCFCGSQAVIANAPNVSAPAPIARPFGSIRDHLA